MAVCVKFLADYSCKNNWRAYKWALVGDSESAKNTVFGSVAGIFGILRKVFGRLHL